MIGLRSLFAIALVLALVASGAMAQDDGGATKIVVIEKTKVEKVKKACPPGCTKPCCAPGVGEAEECSGDCEKCDGECDGGKAECSGKCDEKKAGCGSKCDDCEEKCEGGKAGCSGKCDDCDDKCDEKHSCPGRCGEACSGAKVRVVHGGGAMLLGAQGAERRAMLAQALASLEEQIAKIKAEAEELRAAKKNAEADALIAKWEALKAHHARLKGIGCEATCRVQKVAPAKGGCGGGGCEGHKAAKGPARAFLGIQMAPVDGGVRIVDTVPMSPAALGGIQPDDVLVMLNGKKIAAVEDVAKIIGAMKPGGPVRLGLNRGEGTIRLHLTLGAQPAQVEVVEIEKPRIVNRRVVAERPRRLAPAQVRRMGGMGGMGGAAGRVVRSSTPHAAAAHESAMLHAKLRELKSLAQKALDAGHFDKAAELSKAAHMVAQKLEAMHRRMGGPADAAGFERRLAAVEARLARIERMLERIAKQLDR